MNEFKEKRFNHAQSMPFPVIGRASETWETGVGGSENLSMKGIVASENPRTKELSDEK